MSPSQVVELRQFTLRPGRRDALVEVFDATTTGPARNTYPSLPVREGEHVVVHVAQFEDDAHHAEHLDRLDGLDGLDRIPERLRLVDGLGAHLLGTPQRLRLRPTARSRLR